MFMPQIMVYENANDSAPAHLRFLACFYGAARGEALPMNFTSDTREGAEQSLKDWWTARQSVQPIIKTDTSTDMADKVLAVKVNGPGRGHHFEGKVWVVSRSGAKRVTPDEVDSYLNNGYRRGKKWA